jgi:F-type H+-transporting ATPase subunit b
VTVTGFAGLERTRGMDNPLVQPDPGLFIWTILTFLALLALLAKFAWRPLLKALDARQEGIRKALADAMQARQELERVEEEATRIVHQARMDADAVVSHTRADAERLREEIRQKARSEADTIIKTAEQRIQLETNRALEQIRHEAVDISLAIASKLIQRNLTKDDNERLIDETLKQFEARGH